MNREGAKSAKKERHFLLDLPSRPSRLRGLIIPIQPKSILPILRYPRWAPKQVFAANPDRLQNPSHHVCTVHPVS
jgi:hypothetical protein